MVTTTSTTMDMTTATITYMTSDTTADKTAATMATATYSTRMHFQESKSEATLTAKGEFVHVKHGVNVRI
eukprot:5928119-Ditylum_brightwellii.AAC.2